MTSFLVLLLSLNIWAQDSEPSKSMTTELPSVKDYSNRDLNVGYKPIKLSFFSLASVRTMDMERGGASIGAYNYFGISYKLDKNSQVGFRYVFFSDTPGFKFNISKMQEESIGGLQTQTGDPYFSYSRYDLGQWGEWKLAGQARIHLPMSAYSRAQKTITQFRIETYLDHDIGMYSNFNYTTKLDYYVQSQTAALDVDVPLNEDGSVQNRAIRTTRIASLEHYIDFDISMHKKFSIRPRIGFEDNWYHESKAENLPSYHTTVLKTQAGVEIKPMKSLAFTLALENQTDLIRTEGFGEPENNKWMLITYASF